MTVSELLEEMILSISKGDTTPEEITERILSEGKYTTANLKKNFELELESMGFTPAGDPYAPGKAYSLECKNSEEKKLVWEKVKKLADKCGESIKMDNDYDDLYIVMGK